MTALSAVDTQRQFGRLLQGWRRARAKSQLDLALDAGVSPRHVSFVETGRSSPSRDMVLALATALQVPLRERNALLLAAGYAPVYGETSLAAPELQAARHAIQLILDHQEPHPAVVLNRYWDVVDANESARGFFAFLLGAVPASPPNVLRGMFSPDWFRPYVTNWEAVAESLIQRAHREAVGGVTDDKMRALLAEVSAYPGVPKRWGSFDPSVPIAPIVPVCFSKGEVTVHYFSTITTIGTAQDVTLQELRVECFFPADVATRTSARAHRERWRGPSQSESQ